VKAVDSCSGQMQYVVCCALYTQGGRPSPFDRNMGSRMAIKCAEKLLEQIQGSKAVDGTVCSICWYRYV